MGLMKVHEAIARALADNGVDTVFGLIGEANLYLTNSYINDCGGKYVAAANEAGATLMALGYAALSGRVGVCTVTLGPALTNTMTALVEGVKASLPIVLLCGDTPVEDRDGIQSVNQREFIMATGAGIEQLRSARTVAQDVATALRRAIVERRPVVLNMPVDLQWQEVDYQPVRCQVPAPSMAPASGEAFDNAIGIIAAASRPVIVAGRGATAPQAKQAILRLAERIGAPVATTLKARDLFRDEPFNLGICGTLSNDTTTEILIESDCLISFGASLNILTTSHGSFLKGKRIIQVNSDSPDVGKFAPVDAGLTGDPAATADLMVHWLDEAEIPSSHFCDDNLKARLTEQTTSQIPEGEDGEGTVDFRQAMWRLDQALPADRVLVTDGGRFGRYTWKNFGASGPDSFLQTTNFGSIGLGMGAAIGASVADPSRTIVLVTGDGGFMNGGLAEFNTAVRYKSNLIVILCNDGCYGAEHLHFQRRGIDPAISLLDWPEFAPVAVALGGEGVTVRSPEDFALVEEALVRRRGPLLIDVKLDPARMPES